MLDRLAPDLRIPELLHEIAVELVTDRLHRRRLADDQRHFQIRLAADGLQINPDKTELVVYFVLKFLDVVTAVCRKHYRRLSETCGNVPDYLLPVLLIYQINLVNRKKRGDIDAAAHHRVHEIILRHRTAGEHIRIHNLVFGKNRPDLVEVQIRAADRVQPDTAVSRLLYRDIRLLLVESYAGIVKLLDKNVDVLLVEDIAQKKNEIRAPDNADDLLTATLAHGGAGDKPRNIQNLNIRALVLHCARHHRKRRESIICRLALRTRNLV